MQNSSKLDLYPSLEEQPKAEAKILKPAEYEDSIALEIGKRFMKRWVIIEGRLMEAELRLDGVKTHITMRKEKCPLYNTDFDFKIREALTAVRSLRDHLRIIAGSKQWTLTTRGGANRHGLWHCQVIRDWNCPFCHENMSALDATNTENLYEVLSKTELDPMVIEAIMDGASYDRLADS